MRDDAVLNHIVGRNALVLIARMRELGERQIPVRVHLFGRRRRTRRIHLHVTAGDRFHYHLRVHHISLELYLVKILRESLLVLKASLETAESQCVGHSTRSLSEEGQLRKRLHLTHIAPRLYGAGEFEHRRLSHSVAEPIRSAAYQYGRVELVFPVIVVCKAS